jgi:hypothetical protein
METEEAKAIYRQRSQIAEFPHAWIKERCGLRQFRCRGQEKASMEATWACLSYNIIRWFSIRRKLNAKMIDDACLLPQTQFQALTAGGLRYLPNDIPHSSIYKDFSDALVDQYFHLTPAVLEVCRLDCGESVSLIFNSQLIPVAQRNLKFDVERHESG